MRVVITMNNRMAPSALLPALCEHGLTDAKALDNVGVIIGSIEEDDMPLLRAVEGVADVSPEREFRV